MAKEHAARLLSIGYGRTRSGFIASIGEKSSPDAESARTGNFSQQ